MKANNNPQDTMRALQLTPDEQHMLAEEAERVIAETLAANQLFLASGRQLPRNEWKHIKTREKIHVYRSRSTDPSSSRSADGGDLDSSDGSSSGTLALELLQAGHIRGANSSSNSNGSVSSSSGHASSDQSLMEMAKPTDIPLVIATGIVAGTVEDAVFGALAHTERSWRLRDAHIKDTYEATKILASIVVPTQQDPFRSLIFKWTMRPISHLSRKRDCVFIEATGIAFDSFGERVGYYVMHSVDSIARIPGMKHLDIVRVHLSTCFIVRAHDQSSIEVFARGFSNPGGNFREGPGNVMYADMLLGAIHIVDLSYVKKLIWLMHTKRLSGSAPPPPPSSDARNCGNCTASLSKLGMLIYPSAVCEACKQVVCHKCSVVKKIPMEVSHTEIKHKSLTFCLSCIIEAKEASTHDVALALMQITPS